MYYDISFCEIIAFFPIKLLIDWAIVWIREQKVRTEVLCDRHAVVLLTPLTLLQVFNQDNYDITYCGPYFDKYFP